jgi:hypothetical protein
LFTKTIYIMDNNFDKYIGMPVAEFYAEAFRRASANQAGLCMIAVDIKEKDSGVTELSHEVYDMLGLSEHGLLDGNNPLGYSEAPGCLLYEMYADDEEIWTELGDRLVKVAAADATATAWQVETTKEGGRPAVVLRSVAGDRPAGDFWKQTAGGWDFVYPGI